MTPRPDKTFYRQRWFLWLATAIATYALFRPLRFQGAFPGIDSSVFIYGGWRVARGEMPYIAFWDHKGPLIYLLNALPFSSGRSLAQVPLSSIVWFEMLGMIGAVGSLFLLLRAHLGRWAAVMGICGLVAAFRWPIAEGNYVEEWAFFLNSALVALAFWPAFMRGNESPRNESPRNEPSGANLSRFGRAGAIGVLWMLTLMLRPNEAGVGVAVLIFWLLHHRFSRAARVLWLGFGSGALVTFVSCALWLARGGAWDAFIDQYLVFNALYSSASLTDRWQSVVKGVVRFSSHGTFVVAFCGFALLVWRWRELALRPQNREITPNREFTSEFSPETRLFLRFIALLLPLQIVLSCLSGRAYAHYYLAWWLPCALLCGYTLRNARLAFKPDAAVSRGRLKQFVALVLLLFAVTEWSKSAFGSLRARRDRMEPTVKFIQARTRPDQPVLVWGNRVALHLHSQRPGASRFNYQNAIALTQGATQARYLQDFMADVEVARPGVIIDTSQEYDRKKRRFTGKFPVGLRGFPTTRQWLDRNYRLVGRSAENWLFYERNN